MAEFTVKALQKCVYKNALYNVGDEFLFEAESISDVPDHMEILYAPKEAAKETAVTAAENQTAAEERVAEDAESEKRNEEEETEKAETEAVPQEKAAVNVSAEETAGLAEKGKPAAGAAKKNSKK